MRGIKKIILTILVLVPLFSLSQNRYSKRYKEPGDVSNGTVLTIAGISFFSMGIAVRPLYYGGSNYSTSNLISSKKKPWYNQHHKYPMVVAGVCLTFTGLITILAEK